MELSVMDRINMILSDPEKAPMTLAQIVSEEIREFKASEQYKIILEAEQYYRNRSAVQKKTVDVANRSNAKIERPILKKLVDQKANYLLAKPWTVDTESEAYGAALNEVFDQTFRRKIKSLGKGAVKSGIAWIQPYFDDNGRLAFMRVPSTEVVPLWRDSERTKLDAFIRFYDQVIYIGTRKHTITHAEFWWTGGVKYFKTDAFAGTGAGDFAVDKDHGTEENDWTEPLRRRRKALQLGRSSDRVAEIQRGRTSPLLFHQGPDRRHQLAEQRHGRRPSGRGEVHLYPSELRRNRSGGVLEGLEGTHGDQGDVRRRGRQITGRSEHRRRHGLPGQ